jgi:uncharacterized protein (TIRG00374 family)
VLPVRDVLATMRRIDLVDWLVTLAVFVAGHVVSAAKWQLLANSGADFPTVLRAHFAGLVANLYLPGVAGGDVVRAAALYRKVPDKARLALGSVADRAIDTVALLVIAAAGLLCTIGSFESAATLLAWVGAAVAIFVAAAVLVVRFHRLLLRALPAEGRIARAGEQAAASIVVLSAQRARLALCLALSLVVQCAFIVATIGLAEAAGVHAPAAAWFFAWPLAKLVATLPISIAGLGVREASLAGFLVPFGAPAAAVVGVGLLWQTIQLAGALLGGLFVLVSGHGEVARDAAKPLPADTHDAR